MTNGNRFPGIIGAARVGGGAAIDAGKAVSHELRTPVIVIPTTVASDAPCSALSIHGTTRTILSYAALPQGTEP